MFCAVSSAGVCTCACQFICVSHITAFHSFEVQRSCDNKVEISCFWKLRLLAVAAAIPVTVIVFYCDLVSSVYLEALHKVPHILSCFTHVSCISWTLAHVLRCAKVWCWREVGVFEDDKWLFVKPVEGRQREEGNELVGRWGYRQRGNHVFFVLSWGTMCIEWPKMLAI